MNAKYPFANFTIIRNLTTLYVTLLSLNHQTVNNYNNNKQTTTKQTNNNNKGTNKAAPPTSSLQSKPPGVSVLPPLCFGRQLSLNKSVYNNNKKLYPSRLFVGYVDLTHSRRLSTDTHNELPTTPDTKADKIGERLHRAPHLQTYRCLSSLFYSLICNDLVAY